MADKKEIIKLLDEIADMLEFKGGNKFKVGAYRAGANAIRKENNFEELLSSRKLDEIKGIGKGLQSVLYEYCDTGISSLYDELKLDVPSGISRLIQIKGLGPKKIKTLYTEFEIEGIEDLEKACLDNKLAGVKGFGGAAQAEILKEIERIKSGSGFVLLSGAGMIASVMYEKLQKLPSIKMISYSGDYRRSMEILPTLELVLLVRNKDSFEEDLKKVTEFEKREETYVIKEYKIPCVLHITTAKDEFIKKLFLTTGADFFLKKLNFKPEEIEGALSEEDIFKKLKIPYIIPEMREKEYFSIKKKKLKENSRLTKEEFKGLLHWHTTASDGRSTLEEMLNAAAGEGFKYAAVCDHSKAAYYANGLTEERILLQNKELKGISSKYNLHIFQGIESDILKDGELDYSNDFLPNFDFVVASVHSRFQMPEHEMTARLIKAVENPYTDLLGHPSGRLILQREPYRFNIKKVIDACSVNNVAIEINANPKRLDLDWRYVYYAREKGCLFSINPDAHSIQEIQLLTYGIRVARKAGLQPEEVINCFELEDFKKFLNRKVKRNV